MAARDFAAQLISRQGHLATYADIGRDTCLSCCLRLPRIALPPYLEVPDRREDPTRASSIRMAREPASLTRWATPICAGCRFDAGLVHDPLLSTAMTRIGRVGSTGPARDRPQHTLREECHTFESRPAGRISRAEALPLPRRRPPTAAARWEDEVVLSGYYALAARLDSLYESTPDSAALAAGRATIAAWAREQLQGPIAQQLRSYRVGRISERPINNAQIIAARIYRTRLDLFDRWYQKEGQDVKQAVKDLKVQLDGVTGDSAFAVLEKAVNGDREWESCNEKPSEFPSEGFFEDVPVPVPFPALHPASRLTAAVSHPPTRSRYQSFPDRPPPSRSVCLPLCGLAAPESPPGIRRSRSRGSARLRQLLEFAR